MRARWRAFGVVTETPGVPAVTLRGSADTVYQNLAVTESMGQYTLYQAVQVIARRCALFVLVRHMATDYTVPAPLVSRARVARPTIMSDTVAQGRAPARLMSSLTSTGRLVLVFSGT